MLKKPSITDPLPVSLKARMAGLKAALDEKIPAKVLDRNLLVATWNVRALGGFTDKWKSNKDDSPKRDLFSLRCIAEIVSRFDVTAVQEVKSDFRALRHVLKALGDDFDFFMTDVTHGDAGNGERLAFVFDKRRVRPSGLVCELVVPVGEHGIASGAFDRQFARTPFAVSLRSAGKTFTLVTMHVLYGDDASDRVPELKAVASWLAKWAKNVNAYDHNLILLGDFNIDRKGDPCYRAFTSTGLSIPDGLSGLKRTIFDLTADEDKRKFYDQIAFFKGATGVPALSLNVNASGNFDFTGLVLPELTTQEISWRLSDHLPLWVEFDFHPAECP